MTRSTAVRFREARSEDHETFLRLFAELGVDDPPPDPTRFEEVIMPGAFFAVDEAGRPLAYAFSEVLASEGYTRHVVVDEAARGRGVGRAMMEELARRFREAGCTEQALNVKPDNVAALRLYESCGMKRAYASRVIRLAWDMLPALPAAAHVAVELGPVDHAPFEEAFDVPRALLARLASRGFFILGVRDDAGTPAAVCAHDPRFPGSFPFRARSVEDARALLDASLARRVPIDDAERPWRDRGVQAVVEDHDAVADALLAIGGEEVLVTLHYRGPL